MSYNKSSIKRKMQTTDSTPAKVKNKFIISFIKVVMTFIIVFAVIIGSTGLGVAKGIIDSAPDISDINITPTGYSTSIYASDGYSEIAKLVGSDANRVYVTIEEIPVHMQHAFVAIEDSRFYEHNGIDLYGIARAAVVAVRDILSGKLGQMEVNAILFLQKVINLMPRCISRFNCSIPRGARRIPRVCNASRSSSVRMPPPPPVNGIT